MSDRQQRSNGNSAGEWPPKGHERYTSGAEAVALDLSEKALRLRRVSWRRLSIGIIFGFWVTRFAAYTLYQMLNTPPLDGGQLLPRGLMSTSGLALSFGILAIQLTLRGHRLSVRAVTAIVLAIVGAAVQLLIAREISVAFRPDLVDDSNLWVSYASDLIDRVWIFASISAIILALSYAADIREREERISALQSLAHAAQLRALRYQLNPHFLFNALNSIAGLMSRNRAREAEAMTINLGDFLRSTLALDPQKTITIAEEIQLQELYLDIEKVRFPDRLRIVIDIPDELQSVLVPALITQPLVENSIKYAVARSTEPVELTIAARSHGDRLNLIIEDSGGNAEGPPGKGANVGLSNAADRLRAHYGEDVELQTGAKEGGGFRNMITIPLRRRS